MADQQETTRPGNTPAECSAHPEVDEILRRKRKARGQRACYPCRQRKVKCNYDAPCKTCADRDHPELCLYQLSSKRANVGSYTEAVLPNADDRRPVAPEWGVIAAKIDLVEQSIQDLKNDFRQLAPAYQRSPTNGKVPLTNQMVEELSGDVSDSSTQGIHTNNDLTGETVHLGGNSVPAMVVALGSGSGEETIRGLLGKSILPLFGLDNQSVTYPFVDLWGLPHGSAARIDELCKLLPSDADCLLYFRQYRDIAHVLYPGVVDIHQFESDLTHFLITRSSRATNAIGDPHTEQKAYGMSLHWLGLLFAILASGCQCSGIPRKERQLTSQVYVCCAYECLRAVNYLAHSTLVDIQNLLVLGNVISNSMNAGVAWSFLGLTIRLAQSLGLHQACPPSTTLPDKILKEEVWWRVVWQDSLLSITYDRASSTPTINHHQPVQATPSDGKSYIECMKSLCDIGLDIVRERSERPDHQHELVFIIERREKLAEIMNHASVHLKDAKSCKSIKDQLEYWNLYLHRSYVTSELYRPTLKHSRPNSDIVTSLKATCVESLAETVDAFLGLENITRFARQSWAAVHRALSSALLLGILREPAKNQHVRTLLDRLIAVMSDLSFTLDASEVSAPITRSIAALRRLNSQEIRRKCAGYSVGGKPGVYGNEGDSEASSMFNESPLSSSLAPDKSSDGSPYALMDKIIWGTQQTSST